MAVNYSEGGYRTLTEAGAQVWCEDELENFIGYLTAQVPESEMTAGRIRQEALAYIATQQETESFAPITERCDGTNGLFLGLVITMMGEYLKALVLDRCM